MQLLTESQAGAHSLLFIDGYDHDREYWVRRINISSAEYLVLEADTGAAGLSVCQSWRIDCVVAELSLPYMSGSKRICLVITFAGDET
jgi:CheY-like chemotaxis protein